MRTKLLLLILAPSLATAQEKVNQDNLVFKDGGNLYGEFKGFSKDGLHLNWMRKGNQAPKQYEAKGISQITINGGRPVNNAPHAGYVLLINGDRIPCSLKSLEKDKIVVSTDYSGELSLPRNNVRSFHPSPDGTPFIVNGFGKEHSWQIRDLSGKPAAKAKKGNGQWELHGAAYYALPTKAGILINPDIKLPDEFVCKFFYAFEDYASLNVVFHADMKVPKPKEKAAKPDKPGAPAIQLAREARPSNMVNVPSHFGSSLNLTLGTTGSHQLRANGFDPETKIPFSKPQASSLQSRYSRVRAKQLLVEIQVSRKRRKINLRVNGANVGEWTVNEDDYPAGGNQLGFFYRPSGNGSTRISNFSISEWHGLKDSPKSLVNETQDVILLNNDTDRFAGNLDKFESGLLYFRNQYFNLKVPKERVKLVNFATNTLAEPKALAKEVSIDFYNHGNIQGTLLKSESTSHIILKTQYAEKISIPRAQIRSIKFEDVSGLIESWSKKH